MFGFFTRFVKRICAPEIESHSRLAKDCKEYAEFWYDRYWEEKAEHDQLKINFQLEINSNRGREDALRNQVLTASGAMPLPVRASFQPTKEIPAVSSISKEEEEILRARASDYAEQTLGEKFTKDELEKIYQGMLLNPGEYLND